MNFLPRNLKYLLRKKGISQATLAAAIGMQQTTVSNWTKAHSSPDAENLIRLAEFFGVSLNDLVLTDLENSHPSSIHPDPIPLAGKEPTGGEESILWMLLQALRQMDQKLDRIIRSQQLLESRKLK